MGALSLGTMVAEELGCEYAFLEPINPSDEESELAVKRQTFQEAVADRTVALVEDIITTGGTTSRSIRAIRKASGDVVCVLAMWNRSAATAESLDVPELHALVNRRLPDFTEAECHEQKDGLCFQHIPINLKPGHGTDYQVKHPDYEGGYVSLL